MNYNDYPSFDIGTIKDETGIIEDDGNPITHVIVASNAGSMHWDWHRIPVADFQDSQDTEPIYGILRVTDAVWLMQDKSEPEEWVIHGYMEENGMLWAVVRAE